MNATPRRIVLLVLVALGLGGFLLAGASLPHSHSPHAPGLYNEEHDLGLMAASAAHAALASVASAALFALVLLALAAPAPAAPHQASRHRFAPRAPPAR